MSTHLLNNENYNSVSWPYVFIDYHGCQPRLSQKGEGRRYCLYWSIYFETIALSANIPENIKTYDCANNEVKIMRPLCNLETEEFKGTKKNLAYVNVRGDRNGTFLMMVFYGSVKSFLCKC